MNVAPSQSESPKVATSQRPASVSQPAILDQPVLAQYERVSRRYDRLEELLSGVGELTLRQEGCLAVWLLKRDAQGNWSPQPLVQDAGAEVEALQATLAPLIDSLAVHVERNETVAGIQLASQRPIGLVAAPIHDGNLGAPLDAILCACFDQEGQTLVKCQWLIDRAAHAIQQWCVRQRLNQHQRGHREAGRSLDTVRALSTAKSWQEAQQRFVQRLQRGFRADLVALCLGSHRRLKVTAAAGVEFVDPVSEFARGLAAASEPAIEDERLLVVRPEATEKRATELPLVNWCREQGYHRASVIPLRDVNGDFLGTVLIAGGSGSALETDNLEALPDWLQSMTEQFAVCRAAFVGRRRSRLAGAAEWFKQRAGVSLVIGLIVAGLIMAMPLPYRVGCDCEIQPVVRRMVAAPFEGVLEKSLVDNGQAVTQGQVVARLDGRHLRMELASAESEYAAAAQRHTSALAQKQVAQAQIARSEMERFAADADLIRDRLTQLEVKAPLNGVVISDDLKQAEGATVELGQSLMEIAPVDQMRVEIAIPESEVAYTEVGMSVAIKLHAFPFQTFSGKVEAIHASSEIIDDEVVFVAEVTLDNRQWNLKPGMHGSAKITTGRYPLGWNLFHRPWEAVRHWTLW